MRLAALVLAAGLLPRAALSEPACALTGAYFYAAKPTEIITFAPAAGGGGYTISCEPSCGWGAGSVSLDTERPWSAALFLAFDNGVTTTGWALAPCSPQRVIYFSGAVYGAPWCAVGNAACAVPVDGVWSQPGATVHLAQVSHSDIFWLGAQDDVLVDAANINASLALMAANAAFTWQHECILFLRVYVEMYPEAEAALIARIAEGRFDIGGTFTEGFESTMLNEMLARQMYLGRKWFVERYPALESAVVAFHQDGPLRAAQMPQVYAKAGIKYLKPSRLAEDIVHWRGLDGGPGLIAFPQWQYCEGATQWATSAQDILYRMALFAPQYAAAGLPPQLPVTWGCDYAPPDNSTELFAAWAALSANDTSLPALVYSNFKTWGDAMAPAKALLPVVSGERPNLWIMENSPTHHWMWSDYRDAARLLPAAEAFAAFRSLLEGGFASYPAEVLEAAWLNVSLADHGIAAEPTPKGQGLPAWFVNDASPAQADLLYKEKWSTAVAAADAALTSAQTWLAGAVDVSGAPARAIAAVSVFNALSWARDDAVLDLSPPTGGAAVAIVDAAGATVPSQLSANGTRLIFVAPAVPAFGYSTFFVVPAATMPVAVPAHAHAHAQAAAAAAAPAVGAPWTSPFTNAFYTLTPGAGGLAGVLDLATGAPLFDTSHYDAGEWMELQYTGMGASETHALTAPWYNATTFARLGNLSTPIAWTCTEAGPVRTVFATAEVPTAHSRVQLVVEAYAAIKRLDVRVRVLGWDSAFGVVNRVVFPMAAAGGRNVSYAAPFGVVRVGEDEAMPGFYDMWQTSPPPTASAFERGWASRPREVGDWVRAEAGPATGVTISSSVGAFDWIDPTGAYPSTTTVLSPEMMLHTNSNRSPFLPEPGDHDFLFSITATPPGWQAGWRAGVAPNNPLRSVMRPLPAAPAPVPSAAAAAAATVALPLSQSFINATGETWVTAVKKEDGVGRVGLIVRLFAVAADAARVRIACAWTLASGAATTNLIELDAVDVPGTRGASAVDLQLGAFAIETMRLGVLADGQ